MKKLTKVIFLILVLVALGMNSAYGAWLSGGWDKRVKITVQASKVDANLSNFPFLIYLSASSGVNNDDVSGVFDELTSDANRKKIAVTKSDGITELYVEIEKWDDAAEEAWLWVKAEGSSSIDSSSNTDFYLYYDKDHVANTTYIGDTNTNVWNTNFKAVYHLHGNLLDSTANSKHGTDYGTDDVTGQIAKGRDFIRANGDYVEIDNAGELIAQNEITVEMWIKPDTITEYQTLYVQNDNGSLTTHNFFIAGNTGKLLYNNTLPYGGTISSNTALTTGVWEYVALTRNSGTSVNFYKGGSPDGSGTGETRESNAAVNQTLLGARYYSSASKDVLDGIMDEVRISNVARSAVWIKASYYSGKDDFVAYGSEETTNTAPTIAITESVPTWEAGDWVISYTLTDPEGDSCNGYPEYSTDGSSWTSPATTTPATGTSIGTPGAKTITWHTATDLGSTEDSTVYFRMQAKDPAGSNTLGAWNYMGNTGTSPGTAFGIDNVNPVGLANFTASSSTRNTITYTWTAVTTETNFNHYEVWYGTNQSHVQGRTGTASEWDDSDDSNLTTMSTTATTLTGLTKETQYYAKIWAVDDAGNEQTVSEISYWTDSNSLPQVSAISGSQVDAGASTKVRIDYTLTDADTDKCNFTTSSTQVQYATSLGGTWYNANLHASGTTANVTSSAAGTEHTASFQPLYWDAATDLGATVNGTYYVRIKPHDGFDYAADYATTSSFIIDNQKPSSTVTTSGSYTDATWPGKIEGTADDGSGSGVQSVALTIQRSSDGYYWYGVNWQSGVTWVDAADTTSWYYNLTSTNLDNGVTYTVNSRALDNAGNLQTSYGTSTFSYGAADTTPPTLSGTGNSYVHSTKKLTLTFSESIDVTPTTQVDATKITLANQQTGGNSFALTQAEVDSGQSDGTPVTFTLTDTHRDTISGWDGAGATNLYLRFPTAGAVKDLAANQLAAMTTGQALNTWTKDTTLPTLNSTTWTDVNSDAAINVGDTLLFTFSENMNTSTINSSNVSTRLPLSSGSYGASSTVDWTTPSGNNTLTVTLGSGASIVTGTTVNPDPAVTDLAGNADNTTAPGPSIADTILPAAVTDLAASAGTNVGEVILTWTAPGDDGNAGTATSYDIRYSTATIDTDAKFNSATTVPGTIPSPSVAGMAQSMTVTGLPTGNPLYFALKTQDEVPNTSEFSNSPRPYVLSGTVKDSKSNQAVAGTTVELIDTDGVTVLETATTDDNGKYYFYTHLAAGNYILRFSVHASSQQIYKPVTLSITIPLTSPIPNVSIDPYGIVYDSVTNKPIEGATVTCRNADGTITFTPESNPQATRAEGNFAFSVSQGRYYLTSSARNYKFYQSAIFTVSGAAVEWNIPMDPLTLTSQPNITISKLANKEATVIGDVLTYTVTVKNISSSNITNVQITDVAPHDFKYIPGSTTGVTTSNPTGQNPYIWSIGDLAASTATTLQYRMRVGVDVSLGNNQNSAAVSGAGSGNSAGPVFYTVFVRAGLLTDRGIIIGKVFWDRNRNGFQEKGEPPLGKTILIMEDGTVITTDENGRYSIINVEPGMHVIRLDNRLDSSGQLKETRIRRDEQGLAGISTDKPITDYRSPIIIKPMSIFVDLPRGGMAKGNFAVELSEEEFKVLQAWKELGAKEKEEKETKGAGEEVQKEPLEEEVKEEKEELTNEEKEFLRELKRVERQREEKRKKAEIEERYARGKRYYQVGMLIEALEEWDGLLTLAPEYGRINKYLAEIEEEYFAGELSDEVGEKFLSLKAKTEAGRVLEKEEGQLGPARPQTPEPEPSKETEIIFVGLADGELGSLDVGGNVDYFEEGNNQGYQEDFYTGGRLAYYLKGRIKGKYLITSRLDTSRDYQDRLFKEIDPERFYPIYGDSSNLSYEADSQDKFYVRLDVDKSYALYGNYHTEEFEQQEFSKYSRVLHGVKGHYETRGYTDKEDRGISITVFGSQNPQSAAYDEIAAEGISGPYYLAHTPVLEYSERVVIEVRDQERPEVVLETKEKQRAQDYSIDYDRGRILFNQPIPSQDSDGNPIYIVVKYEYLLRIGEQDLADNRIIGTRIEGRPVKPLTFGATYVEETNTEDWQLFSLDARWRLGKNAQLYAEGATTDRDTMEAWEKRTSAYKLEFAYKVPILKSRFLRLEEVLQDRLKFKTYYRRIGREFSNPDNITEQGVEGYGLRADLRLTRYTTSIWDFYRKERLLADDTTRSGALVLKRKRGRLTTQGKYELKDYHDKSGVLTDTRKHIGSALLGWDWTKRLSSSLEHELTWKEERHVSSPRNTKSDITTFLTEYKTDKEKLYLRHEYLDGVDSIRNTTAIGIEKQVDEHIKEYMEYQMKHREREVKSGINVRHKLTRSLSTDFNLERIKSIRNPEYRSDAASLALKFEPSDRLSTSIKYERRRQDHDYTKHLGIYNIRGGVTESVTLLGKFTYGEKYDNSQDGVTLRDSDLILGVAYRPVSHDRLNLLAKYRLKKTKDLSAASLTTENTMSVGSLEGIYDLSNRWHLFAKYARREVEEKAGGLSLDSTVDVITTRLTYDISKRLDILGEYRILKLHEVNDIKTESALESGYTFLGAIRVAGGYRFIGYEDGSVPGNDYDAGGFYVRFSGKFSPVKKSAVEKKAQKHYQKGKRYYRKGDFNQAQVEFNQVLALNPELERARRYLVRIPGEIKKQRAQEVKKGSEYYFNKAVGYIRRHKYEKARVELNRVLRIEPAHPQAPQILEKLERITGTEAGKR